VESISIDAVVKAEDWTDSTLRGTLALPLYGGGGGSGVGVAVIDSGIEPGPDFGDRITGFYDFTEGGGEEAPTDGYGHGTHVAGLIGGDGSLSQKQYRGVAPRSRLVVLKVLDENGVGRASDVIAALEFVTTNKDALDVDIINLSLGHPIYEPAATDPLVQAVEAAARAGLIVIAAAGNHGIAPETAEPGYAGIVSPANAPSAIAVGAAKSFDTNVRSDDRIAPYSSRGPSWYDGLAKPDIVAPGHALVSTAARHGTIYLNSPSLRVGDSYLSLSGTSMAAAVVTGTAALVLQAHREVFSNRATLTPNAMKAILQAS
jgi:serine protease AprX